MSTRPSHVPDGHAPGAGDAEVNSIPQATEPWELTPHWGSQAVHGCYLKDRARSLSMVMSAQSLNPAR